LHAVLVTCSSSVPADVSAPLTRRATDLVRATGLTSVTWIADGSVIGGFHVFTDAAAADRYLSGDVFEGLRGDRDLYAFEIRRFAVLDDALAAT
jgi:hypothetical protein